MEKAYEFAQQFDAEVVSFSIKMETFENNIKVCNTEYKFRDEKVFSTRELLDEYDKSFPAICVCAPVAKLYKVEVIKNNNILFDEEMSRAEDTYFNLQILSNVNTVFVTNYLGYIYKRVNTDSLYNKFHKDIYEIHKKVFEKLRELIRINNSFNDTIERSYFSNLVNGLYEHFKCYNKTSDEEVMSYLKKIGKDDDVKRYRFKDFDGKFKFILLFLKLKMYRVIVFICKRKYKKIIVRK